ncbi:hypothetical protein [Burkholderia pyrrocinia]
MKMNGGWACFCQDRAFSFLLIISPETVEMTAVIDRVIALAFSWMNQNRFGCRDECMSPTHRRRPNRAGITVRRTIRVPFVRALEAVRTRRTARFASGKTRAARLERWHASQG